MNKYIFFILLLLFLACLFLYVRKLLAVRKVCAMSVEDKLARINQISVPSGFHYKLSQDVFTSEIDAWQKDCGYCAFYDSTAPLFNMIFDCEPVYFNYNGATWLVEFWKGQYGITTGCEIGCYKAGRILTEDERKSTLFQTVSGEEMPVFFITLLKDGLPVSRLCERHWWLTSFGVGKYTEPENLAMKITIVFPSAEMCKAFVHGLRAAGYHYTDFYLSGEACAFTFGTPHSLQPFLRRSFYSRWVQLKNRALLSLFLRLTRPFRFTLDRLILLYEYLPLLSRHILKLRRMKKKRRRKHER